MNTLSALCLLLSLACAVALPAANPRSQRAGHGRLEAVCCLVLGVLLVPLAAGTGASWLAGHDVSAFVVSLACTAAAVVVAQCCFTAATRPFDVPRRVTSALAGLTAHQPLAMVVAVDGTHRGPDGMQVEVHTAMGRFLTLRTSDAMASWADSLVGHRAVCLVDRLDDTFVVDLHDLGPAVA